MFSVNGSNYNSDRKSLCFRMQMLRYCCTVVIFSPPCGSGEQAVLKDVLWLAWLQFIKSKVSRSGLFVLKAWNEHKQNSVKSELLALFFFSHQLSYEHTSRCQSCWSQWSVPHWRQRHRRSIWHWYKILVLLLPAVGWTGFLRLAEMMSVHWQLEKSLYWNKPDFSVD